MSPPKPRLSEWEIGKDAYGRPVMLRRDCRHGSREEWSIVSEPVSQRDEGERCRSLTLANLQAIADIVGKVDRS